MSNKSKKGDWFLRLLSLALAIVLWAIVMGTENPNKEKTFRLVPVAMIGESELYDNYGLSVIEGAENTVSVRIRGQNKAITSMPTSRITVSADLSEIKTAGEYDLALKASLPNYTSEMEIISISQQTVHIRVDQVTETNVPVKLSVSGTPASGYRAGTATTTTEQVTVTGPATELSEVAYAMATIGIDGATGTVQQDCTVSLYNSAGEVLSSEHIRPKTETLRVTVKIYQNGEVPLTVQLQDGDTVSADMASVSIEPQTIEVYGDQNIISSLSEIDLGVIDLDSVKTGTAITRPIHLPSGVSPVEGQPTMAKITVLIDGVETEDVSISNIVLTDTANDVSAYTVRLASETVRAQVRGARSALSGLDAASFTVDVQVDASALSPGAHTVKGRVTATGLPDGVTLLDDTAEVQIVVESTTDTAEDNTEDAAEPAATTDTAEEEPAA